MPEAARKQKNAAKKGTRENRVRSGHNRDGHGSTHERFAGEPPHAKYYLAALVALVTFLVYYPALKNGFVNWDDPAYVYDNPHLRSLNGSFFRWAFFDFYACNWHPLTWVSHALDYAIWGVRPGGHHLTNNVLHALCAGSVVLLAVQLLEIGGRLAGACAALSSCFAGRGKLIAAATTGLVFGLHPLHVESVAWVAERKDLLCALFFLSSITTYLSLAGGSGRTRPAPQSLFQNKKYYLVIFLFSCALLSKPMAVSLPFVLLILDWYPPSAGFLPARLWRLLCTTVFPYSNAWRCIAEIFARRDDFSD